MTIRCMKFGCLDRDRRCAKLEANTLFGNQESYPRYLDSSVDLHGTIITSEGSREVS